MRIELGRSPAKPASFREKQNVRLQILLFSAYIADRQIYQKISEVFAMITPMFGNRRKPKKFNLPLRHYDPSEDERKKRRIKFKRPYRKTHQGRSVLLYAAGLALVVWIITLL